MSTRVKNAPGEVAEYAVVAPARASNVSTRMRLIQGRPPDMYSLLHPAQRAVVRKAKFIDCENQVHASGRVLSLKVLSTSHKRILVPGTSTTANTLVVKARVHYRVLGSETTVTNSYHLARASGRWAWMLVAADVYAYRAGRCPS